jgi:hypothetical protein
VKARTTAGSTGSCSSNILRQNVFTRPRPLGYIYKNRVRFAGSYNYRHRPSSIFYQLACRL